MHSLSNPCCSSLLQMQVGMRMEPPRDIHEAIATELAQTGSAVLLQVPTTLMLVLLLVLMLVPLLVLTPSLLLLLQALVMLGVCVVIMFWLKSCGDVGVPAIGCAALLAVAMLTAPKAGKFVIAPI